MKSVLSDYEGINIQDAWANLSTSDREWLLKRFRGNQVVGGEVLSFFTPKDAERMKKLI